MKAIITQQVSNARNYSGEKELIDRWQVCVNTPEGIKSVIDARCWMGRSRNASTVYASVWVNGNGTHTSGKGNAGGYGYHKTSAAMATALSDAGIELYGSPYAGRDGGENERAHIGGCGEGSIEAALLAIAAALGYADAAIV